MRVVKAYRQEKNEIDSFAVEAESYVGLNLNLARLQGVLFPFIRMLAASVNLIILGVGGMEVIRGETQLGTLVAFLTYVNALFWPMFAMGWVGLTSAWLPRLPRRPRLEVVMLAVWGLLWGIGFGFVFNVWFWPFVYDATQALELGLVDRIGYLADATAEAKSRAGVRKAKVVTYSRQYRPSTTAYAATPVQPGQVNLLNVDVSSLARLQQPQFLYLWAPGAK